MTPSVSLRLTAPSTPSVSLRLTAPSTPSVSLRLTAPSTPSVSLRLTAPSEREPGREPGWAPDRGAQKPPSLREVAREAGRKESATEQLPFEIDVSQYRLRTRRIAKESPGSAAPPLLPTPYSLLPTPSHLTHSFFSLSTAYAIMDKLKSGGPLLRCEYERPGEERRKFP